MIKDAIARLLDQVKYAPHITITPVFAWYDLWIGVYVDRPKRAIYVLPLPCIGVRISWVWEEV